MFPYFQYSVKKIFDFLKKAFIVIVVYMLIIGLFAHFISDDNKNTIAEKPAEKNNEILYNMLTGPQAEKSISASVYRGILCFFIGEVCTDNPADAQKNFKNSAFGFTTNLISLSFSNPPASGMYWAYAGLQEAGFVPKTYAAEGIGFTSINPLMGIWKTFRNITYVIIVLIIVTIGFMIMFRMKLNQQTVISLENSLPRLVIALLLITFSFPIAGFLIDLMYFLIVLSVYIFSLTGIGDLNLANLTKMQNEYIGAGFWRIWPYDMGPFPIAVGQAMVNLIPDSLTYILNSTLGYFVTILLTKLYTWFISKVIEIPINMGITTGGSVVGTGGSVGFNLGHWPNLVLVIIYSLLFVFFLPNALAILFSIMFTLTLLFFLFRIFFLLLTSYIKILILIIFSPFILLFEAIPGKNSFSFWLKSLFGELLAFPIVVIISLIGYALTKIYTSGSPYLPLPFIGSLLEDASSFSAILGFGLILMTPDLIKMIREGLGMKGLPLAVGPGTFFGGVVTPVGGVMGLLGSYSSIAIAFPGVKNMIAGKLPILTNLLGADPKSIKETLTAGPGSQSPQASSGGGSH